MLFRSVRATLGLYERAQANAILHKRKTVTFGDIQEVIESVLAHRIKLKPSVKYLQDPTKFVSQEFENFKVKNPGFSSAKEKKGEVPG